MGAQEREGRGWQYLGVGCITTVAGFFGGGMIGVFVGWIVGHARGCTPAPDTFPICDFFPYWLTGMCVGMLLVPIVALTQLRRGSRASEIENKGDLSGTR